MTSVSGPTDINALIANSNALVTGGGIDPALLEQEDQMDKDTFLQLMVAQLKYQNPLEPVDSSQFMAQTAQFTSVEKLTELTNTIAESLVNDRLGTATGMIGRDVTFVRPADGVTTTASVTGVRFSLSGPLLLLSDGSEVVMGQIESVTTPTATPAPVTAPADPATADPATADPATTPSA